jgi:hypothetical protein
VRAKASSATESVSGFSGVRYGCTQGRRSGLASVKDGLLPVRPSNLHRAQQQLDAIIADVAARYRDDLAPAIDVYGRMV